MVISLRSKLSKTVTIFFFFVLVLLYIEVGHYVDFSSHFLGIGRAAFPLKSLGKKVFLSLSASGGSRCFLT